MRHLLGLQKCRLPEGSNMAQEREGQVLKEGPLYLIQPTGSKVRKVPVYVKVYRNSFEHYAVISKEQFFCNKCTFISLKNCFVFPKEGHKTQLRIVPNNIEGNAVVFDIGDTREVTAWMDALQSDYMPSSPQRISISPNLSPVIPRAPILQTLTETDEEE